MWNNVLGAAVGQHDFVVVVDGEDRIGQAGEDLPDLLGLGGRPAAADLQRSPGLFQFLDAATELQHRLRDPPCRMAPGVGGRDLGQIGIGGVRRPGSDLAKRFKAALDNLPFLAAVR